MKNNTKRMTEMSLNKPLDYYKEQFYALEEIRQWLIKRSTSTQPFRKAAVFIEKAQNEMLKEGR